MPFSAANCASPPIKVPQIPKHIFSSDDYILFPKTFFQLYCLNDKIKNAFYAQSGGVTAVINASACGVIETVNKSKKFTRYLLVRMESLGFK